MNGKDERGYLYLNYEIYPPNAKSSINNDINNSLNIILDFEIHDPESC